MLWMGKAALESLPREGPRVPVWVLEQLVEEVSSQVPVDWPSLAPSTPLLDLELKQGLWE